MERKIGEVFQDGEVTLKVEEHPNCEGCYFDMLPTCSINAGDCADGSRSDDKNVIFTQITK